MNLAKLVKIRIRLPIYKFILFCFFLILILSSAFIIYADLSAIWTFERGIARAVTQSIELGDSLRLREIESSSKSGGFGLFVVFRKNETTAKNLLGDLSYRYFELFPCYFFGLDPERNIKLIHELRFESESRAEIARLLIGKNYNWELLVITLVSLSFLFLIVAQYMFRGPLNAVDEVSKQIYKLIAAIESKNREMRPDDFFDEMYKLYQVYIKQQSLELEIAQKHASLVIARQVSHDIRSPLSALEMASSSLFDVPEEKRVLIRNAVNRIRDIANSLVSKTAFVTGDTPTVKVNYSEEAFSVIMVASVLDSIITEKRLQYRELLLINIEFNYSLQSYGLFISVQPNEFKRVISNLIDNAVEACSLARGKVECSVNSDVSNVTIVISDDGKGIPENILTKLGNRGFSYNKVNGSGLGLNHAMETLKAFGGELIINSEVNKGTAIALILKKQKHPSWFVDRLALKKNSKVVIFDDDQTVHQVWKGRLDSAGAKNYGVEIFNIATPNLLRKFYGSHLLEIENFIFLMDYELLSFAETGLDLIEELGLFERAILVTSRYEESSIRQKCDKLNVKLIPKPMTGFIPIDFL